MNGFAIFIDGPLAQEIKLLPDLPPWWDVMLPERETVCWCDPERESITESKAGRFRYHRVMQGGGMALYSKEREMEAVLHAVRAWVVTDLSNTDKIYYSCRDRRAFS